MTVTIPNSIVTAPITLITHPSDPAFPADLNRKYFEMTDNGFDYTVSASFSNGDYFTFANATETALPIQLVKFEATLNDQSVYLEWITASETNNDYFSIEKSNDASNWDEVVRIQGAGNSSQTTDYNYTDLSVYSGISYYRLKQTDFDGSHSYSDIKVVNYEAPFEELFLYPNPTNTFLIIERNNLIDYKIGVYNSFGQRIISIKGIVENRLELNTTNLPDGIYYLKIFNQFNSETRKFIIKKN